MNPTQTLRDLAEATAVLLAAVDKLSDADARAPSLLPGWTRGHVLSHLARNAEGSTRLLCWARTGRPSYEYQSLAARAADIEEGASRPAAVLAQDVRLTAAGLAAEAALLPPEAWQHTVRWTAGQQTPAAMVPPSRLAEVLIHHVDLDVGYRPEDWPAGFVAESLARVTGTLNRRDPARPPVRLLATGTGWSATIGDGAAGTVSGPDAALLAWLLGRSGGAGLGLDPEGPLPEVPAIY
jgi:maleylpyruvate isomerase